MENDTEKKSAERVSRFIRETNQRKIFEEIQIERMVQDDKWGKDRALSGFKWLVILMEEVGEAAEQVLERNNDLLRKELIQVAAVAFAHLECIERQSDKK